MLALLLLLALLAPSVRPAHAKREIPRRVCSVRTRMAHDGVAIPFSAPSVVKVPLVLHFRCDTAGKATGQTRPLLIFMQAALARPRDYSDLASSLARKGFIVAIPDYFSRALFKAASPVLDSFKNYVLETRRMGFRCPRNGQFVTVKLITSVLKFFLASKGPRRDIRRVADLSKTIIFGHTFGGAVSERALNDVCAEVDSPAIPPPVNIAFDPQLQNRIICEQFKPFQPAGVRIWGIVTYEGFTNDSVLPVPEGTFYVVIHSPFYVDNIANFFTGKSFDGRAAIVMITNANHYAPGNYVTENENQRPVCARVRPPPENMFMTTRSVQETVIQSIASVIFASYKVFVEGKGMKRLAKLTARNELLVEEVNFL